MTNNPASRRPWAGAVCAVLSLLLAGLFVWTQFPREVERWIREVFVPFLTRRDIMKVDVKALDVTAVVLIVEFFLGMYALIFALLAVRAFEGGKGEPASKLVWGMILLAGLAIPIYMQVHSWKFAAILHLGIVLVYLGAIRRMTTTEAAVLAVLLVALTAFKTHQLDHRLNKFHDEILVEKKAS